MTEKSKRITSAYIDFREREYEYEYVFGLVVESVWPSTSACGSRARRMADGESTGSRPNADNSNRRFLTLRNGSVSVLRVHTCSYDCVYIYIYIHIYMYTLLPGKLHDTRLWCIDWKLGLQVAFWRLRRKGVWINSRFLIKIPHELALRVIVTSSFRLFQLLFTLLSPLFEPRISLPPAKRGG